MELLLVGGSVGGCAGRLSGWLGVNLLMTGWMDLGRRIMKLGLERIQNRRFLNRWVGIWVWDGVVAGRERCSVCVDGCINMGGPVIGWVSWILVGWSNFIMEELRE